MADRTELPRDPMERDSLLRQLVALRVYGSLTYPFACIPFLWFWFSDHGIDLTEYGILVSAYYAAMFIAELPTGLFADRFGRRTAMFLGPVFLAVSFIVMWGYPSFTGFLTSEIIFGVGHALLSGPPGALLYDSLTKHGREGEFLQEESRIHAFRLIGTGTSFAIGGVVAAWLGIAATLPLAAAFSLLAAVTTLFVTEAPLIRQRGVSLLRGALRDVSQPSVRALALYYVLLFCLLRYAFHNYQPYLASAVDDSAAWLEAPLFLGLLYGALNLVAAPASRLTPKLMARFGSRALHWAMPISLVLSLALMASLPPRYGFCVLVLQQLPFGVHWGLIQDDVNSRIQGAGRATVLSILSLAGRLGFCLISIPLFALQDQAGIPTAFYVAAGIGLIGTLGALHILPRRKRDAAASQAS